MKRVIPEREVDTREVPAQSDPEIVGWLGEDMVRWDSEGLVIRMYGGMVMQAPPGWLLVRWPGGELSVMSHNARHLHFGDEIPQDPDHAPSGEWRPVPHQ